MKSFAPHRCRVLDLILSEGDHLYVVSVHALTVCQIGMTFLCKVIPMSSRSFVFLSYPKNVPVSTS